MSQKSIELDSNQELLIDQLSFGVDCSKALQDSTDVVLDDIYFTGMRAVEVNGHTSVGRSFSKETNLLPTSNPSRMLKLLSEYYRPETSVGNLWLFQTDSAGIRHDTSNDVGAIAMHGILNLYKGDESDYPHAVIMGPKTRRPNYYQLLVLQEVVHGIESYLAQ